MMVVSPVLLVKVIESGVSVRARYYDDFAEHEIILNSVITYWWANDLPPAKKFLELFDSVIKRTINEIIPHKILNLKYDVKANQNGVGFKIDAETISLKGLRKVDDVFEPKEFTTTFDQCIETPDIVLKKYKEMKE